MSVDAESPRLSVPVLGMQRLTQAQFGGVIALLVGASQMMISLVAIDGVMTFLIGSGGGLLVSIGINLVRSRPAFYNGWKEDGEYGRVGLLILTLLTGCVVIATGVLLLG
ncbi:hypothetical protein SAMN04487946_10778 [Halobellus clavatus]|uniref:Uncharacterized protein n=1 Tax=Halobellus clavatus TaxID=660517 RepID=A0A1H3HH55_9EURY|nr:hypothetical protein SAMN04487946_10778 [Halobellus clavatus]